MAVDWPLMVVTMTGKTAVGTVIVVMGVHRQHRKGRLAVRCIFLTVLRHAPLAQHPSDQLNLDMAGIWTGMATVLVANESMMGL